MQAVIRRLALEAADAPVLATVNRRFVNPQFQRPFRWRS